MVGAHNFSNFLLIFWNIFPSKHVMTLVQKVAFPGPDTRDEWLFEARFEEFSRPSFAEASRGLDFLLQLGLVLYVLV
jgi:hypothetical protein